MSGFDDEDLPPSAEEAAQAEALARVLGKQRVTSQVPWEALAAARLIELHDARSEALGRARLTHSDEERILERVLAEAKLPASARAESRSSWERLITWLGAPTGRAWALAGSAVAVVSVVGVSALLLQTERSESALASRARFEVSDDKASAAPGAPIGAGPTRAGGAAGSSLPEPPVALLRAQAEWIAAQNEREAFARGMRDYRGEVYLAMGDR